MTTETIRFNLLFDAATTQAVSGINSLTTQVNKLEAGVKAKTAGIRSSFTQLGGNLTNGLRSGFSSLGSTISGATTQLGTFTAGMSPVGGAMMGAGAAAGVAAAGVAAVGAAMVAGAFAAGKYADAIDDAANAIDVSNRFYQEQSALVVRAGGEAAAFEKGMARLNVTLGDAALGDKTASEAFSALGISVRDAAGNVKDNETIFQESRAALAGVSNDAERAALANELFGKGAKDMNGILSMTAEEYAALTSEVAAYGIASDENIAKAGKLGDGMDALGQAMRAGVINAFAPLAESMGNFAMNIAPLVGRAFSAIGQGMDFLQGIGMMLRDAIGFLWNVFADGVRYITNLIPGFDRLSGWFSKLGQDSRSLRDKFIDTMQAMMIGAGRVTGSIAAFFARMAARIYNSVADVKNGIHKMGMGRFFGIDGQTAKLDVDGVGEAARAGVEGVAARAAGSLDSYRARPGEAGDDRNSTGRVNQTQGGAAGGGAASAANAAAEATTKYEEALAKLKQAQTEAAYSEEQKAIADALTAAGLPRIVDLENARSVAIRDQVLATREAEAAARADRTAEDLAQKTRDAALSAEDLARVEARRTAGVSDNLEVTNEYIARLDAQAVATHRAAQAALQLKANEEAIKQLHEAEREAEYDRRELAGEDPIQIDYDREIDGINAATEALREHIIASTQEGELRDQQIAQLERLRDLQYENAEAAKEVAEADRTADTVDKLADKMVDLWERPKEAFADFLKQVLLGFAKMAAANIFNGKGLTDGMGIGGMFKSVIGSVFGFGGFKAEGGPVSAGKGYIVGEQGREYFRPHTDGDIIPNHALGGGQSVSISMPLEYHAAPGGSAQNDMHEAARIQRMIDGRIKTALTAAGLRY